VATLAIDKVGPRPYHFRLGPGSQNSKTKISTEMTQCVLSYRLEFSATYTCYYYYQ